MLVSCIMPTYNRRQFIPQALKYFAWQDYADKELIIVDDGEDKIGDLLPGHLPICYITLSERCTLGMKRNIACSLAKGAIICHFDDDDYYGPQRLTRQVTPLLSGDATVSAFRMSHLLDIRDMRLWSCAEWMHSLLFVHNVRGGTLCYDASLWREGLYYPSCTVGEDARFLYAILARGGKLARLVDHASYICIRHGANDTADLNVEGVGWQQENLQGVMSDEDRAFYAHLRIEHERLHTAEANADIAHMKGLL